MSARLCSSALGGEGEDGGGEAAGEEVAALGGQFADGAGRSASGREALEAVVDAFVGEPAATAVSALAMGSSSDRCALQYMQHALRISLTAV